MPDRPEISTVLTPDDLLPGDVLLSRGETNCGPDEKLPTSERDLVDMLERQKIPSLADVICGLDGGAYSHASMWTERGTAEVGNAEATRAGIKLNPLSIDVNEQVYIDIFRFRSGEHRLGDDDWPAQPIVGRAYFYTDDDNAYQYAYDKLVLMALLLVAGKVPKRPIVKLLVNTLGPLMVKWIDENITGKDKRAMICTELVCRCYWEGDGDPTRKYGIEIDIDGTRSVSPMANTLLADLPQPDDELHDPDLAAEYEALTQACAQGLFGNQPDVMQPLAALHHEHLAAAKPTGGGVQPLGAARRSAKAGGALLPAQAVTPRDMQQSPSLTLIGRLDARPSSIAGK